MPSFGRFSKLQHSNRSQQGLAVDPPAVATGAAFNQRSSAQPSSSSAASPLNEQQQQDQQQDQQQQQQQQHPPRTSSRNPDLFQRSAAEQQYPAAHSFAGRGNHQQPHPAAPHPHFYQAGSNPSDLQDSVGGGSPLYDTSPPLLTAEQPQPQEPQQSQDQQQGRDFADSAALAQSQNQRYSSSTILPVHAAQQNQPQNQQQRLSTAHQYLQHDRFSTSNSSLEDLSQPPGAHQQQGSAQQLQPQPPQPPQPQQHEKRSTRKLIRGIFSGGNRASVIQDAVNQPPPQARQQQQQQQHSQSSYDNVAAPRRRLSKRASGSRTPLPALSLNTGNVAQTPQPPSANPDWQGPDPHSQLSSPLQDLGEAENHSLAPANTNRHVLQDPRTHNDTARSTVQQPRQEQHQQQHQQQQQQQLQSQRNDDNLRQGLDTDQQSSHSGSFLQRASQINFHKAHLIAPQPAENNRLDPAHFASPLQQANADTVSQVSRESPVTDADQRSASQSDEPSPANRYEDNSHDFLPTPEPQLAQPDMSPPSGGPPQARRGQESEKGLRSGDGSSVPTGFRQSNSSSQALNSMVPGAAPGGPPNPAFGQADQGRHSPQPSNPDSTRDADGEKAFKELLVKYKNVKRLYFDGKAQIDALSSQVETLQNAVANQRMSASRTAWDDNEYTTRFSRLNGAINNLSFNIRKDWQAVPEWLNDHVSPVAIKTGKQEMTAVGRAVISRWLMDEVFNRCFHPSLDPVLSAQLKEIELSIRGNSHTIHSQEESDALTTKVVNWRMATLDGLSRKLNAPSANDMRASFTTKSTAELTRCLYTFLTDPAPPGVEGSATMIVELAVAIAANIPLESRDVAITYPLPNWPVDPSMMDVEKPGLPSLDGQKEGNGDEGDKKNGKDARVRFAGFVALEVKGRQVLMKAPVWT